MHAALPRQVRDFESFRLIQVPVPKSHRQRVSQGQFDRQGNRAAERNRLVAAIDRAARWPAQRYGDGGGREKNVEGEGKRLTETVGRMLQCMSVLTGVGVGGGGDEASQKCMEELTRGLKLNWLGRGRMGRDRRGLVGARVPILGVGVSVGGS